MTPAEVHAVMSHARELWPRLNWPPPIVAEAAARLSAMSISDYTARSALTDLAMTLKWPPAPCEFFEHLRKCQPANFANGPTPEAQIDEITRKWTQIFARNLNLRGTAWMTSDWLPAARPDLLAELRTVCDEGTAKTLSDQFCQQHAEMLQRRPTVEPWVAPAPAPKIEPGEIKHAKPRLARSPKPMAGRWKR